MEARAKQEQPTENPEFDNETMRLAMELKKKAQEEKNSTIQRVEEEEESESDSKSEEEEEKGTENDLMLDTRKESEEHDREVAPRERTSITKDDYTMKIVTSLEIHDMKSFLLTKLVPNNIFQCIVKREKSGLKRFTPIYKMYFSHNNQFFLAAKKRFKNKTSNYLISMSETEFSRKSDKYIGKLRSNFLGTEFNLYDTGQNPKKATSFDNIRKQVVSIKYVGSSYSGIESLWLKRPQKNEGADSRIQGK